MRLKVIGTQEALETVGINEKLIGKTGELVKVYSSGYFLVKFDEIKDEHGISFAIPRTFLQEIVDN